MLTRDRAHREIRIATECSLHCRQANLYVTDV
jgi:hypothetical protein